MKEIRIGIIGTGIIAHQHAEGYAKVPGVKITAACDLQRPKLEKFCTQYKIENLYDNFREMLKRDDLDAIDVCLHNNLHAPVSIETMRSGKHCYCEKPMAGSYVDAAAMLAASEETGKRLHIQLSMLYSASTHAAKKLIAAGLVGEIYHARSYGYRRRGRPFVDGYGEKEFNSKYWASGGALYDMGVYHISQMLFVLGMPKVERVSGQVYQKLDMHEGRRKEGGFDVEELGIGLVKFSGGLTMDLIESWAINAAQFPPSFVAGSKGGFSLGDELIFTSEMAGYPAETKFDLGAEVYRTHQIDPALALYDNSIAHWIGALRGECELLDTKRIALETMLVSEGIYQSGAKGREVTAEEIRHESVPSYVREQETAFGTLKYSL
ncbi:MAG: Gfo/Idh/MocA family oxidoreductase [Treponema sp.]|jgi:predicted dehydrogenase|nr:Gfo/Idh/MocA family oxidoreductase [Treponema sp.]